MGHFVRTFLKKIHLNLFVYFIPKTCVERDCKEKIKGGLD